MAVWFSFSPTGSPSIICLHGSIRAAPGRSSKPFTNRRYRADHEGNTPCPTMLGNKWVSKACGAGSSTVPASLYVDVSPRSAATLDQESPNASVAMGYQLYKHSPACWARQLGQTGFCFSGAGFGYVGPGFSAGTGLSAPNMDRVCKIVVIPDVAAKCRCACGSADMRRGIGP